MTVIDIRNIFSDRHIDLIDVNASYICYAEEKNEEGHNDLYILEYNRKSISKCSTLKMFSFSPRG